MVEGEEAGRGQGTPRAVEQKEEPDGRGIIRIGGMQGNGRERNRKGPPRSPPPSPNPPRPGKSCARCKEQDRGWLCCQKNLARLPPSSCCVLQPTHTPSFPCLVGTEGGGRPYAQVRRILQQTLLMVRVDVVVALDRSPSEV